MKPVLRRFLAALTHSGPGYEPPHQPVRGDAFEAWLKGRRDERADGYGHPPDWFVVDDLLNHYRLHADTGTPLDQHVCEGRVVGDCECLEVADV